MKRTTQTELSKQLKRKVAKQGQKRKQVNSEKQPTISTGSTLLDLAIYGSRKNGGGIPGGLLVEIFGPSSSGKTVLLCEIAGGVQRQGGQVMFRDPEGRLDKTFARLFDLNVTEMEYDRPSTVLEVFQSIQTWEPEPQDKKTIHGVFVDSLAALTTEWELGDKDAYGMRRALEFSQELRKTCRMLVKRNLICCCSNQVRMNVNVGPYGQKYKSPGGEAIPFYASLRLKMGTPQKIKVKKKIARKEVTEIVGIKTEIEVFKNSKDRPHRRAPLIIIFNYGIDDIRSNLQYIKDLTGKSVYTVDGQSLGRSLDAAVTEVEKMNLESELRKEVIKLWKEIEDQFYQKRKGKVRV